jgi:hypothetical protein
VPRSTWVCLKRHLSQTPLVLVYTCTVVSPIIQYFVLCTDIYTTRGIHTQRLKADTTMGIAEGDHDEPIAMLGSSLGYCGLSNNLLGLPWDCQVDFLIFTLKNCECLFLLTIRLHSTKIAPLIECSIDSSDHQVFIVSNCPSHAYLFLSHLFSSLPRQSLICPVCGAIIVIP